MYKYLGSLFIFLFFFSVVSFAQSEEFYGPFKSWSNVKNDYHAAGDGVQDDTKALQFYRKYCCKIRIG